MSHVTLSFKTCISKCDSQNEVRATGDTAKHANINN